MRRRLRVKLLAGALAIIVAALVALFAIPVSHQHSAGISLATLPASAPSECGTTIWNQTFPSWFSGEATLQWSAGAVEVSLWVNLSSGASSGSTTVYESHGTGGGGSVEISEGKAYQFSSQDCTETGTTVEITVSVPYSAPLL
jgi:hypothetical protein